MNSWPGTRAGLGGPLVIESEVAKQRAGGQAGREAGQRGRIDTLAHRLEQQPARRRRELCARAFAGPGQHREIGVVSSRREQLAPHGPGDTRDSFDRDVMGHHPPPNFCKPPHQQGVEPPEVAVGHRGGPDDHLRHQGIAAMRQEMQMGVRRAIASGNVGAAARRVEAVLGGLLSLAINFLAGFAGLGKVVDKVRTIIERICAPIDHALDKLVAWIARLGQRFVSAGRAGAGKPLQ